MKKTNLIIVGSSGHAKVIIDIFEKQNNHHIIGLLDAYKNVDEETLGYKVIGSLNQIDEIIKKNEHFEMFVAFGDNWVRQEVVNIITSLAPDINFATAIHPSAQIGRGTKIGKGVAIMANVVINSESNIGDFTFLNTKSSADHDAIMYNFSSLGPNATLGGNVIVGEYSAISIGATTKEKLKIGKHSIIGAGALLLSDCPDNVIMCGIPAKITRDRRIGEKYI